MPTRTLPARSILLLTPLLVMLGAPAPADAAPRAAARIERMVLLMRHGVRAPLDSEVPAGTRAAQPWPRWSAPAEQVTPHGAKAVVALGRSDRRWLTNMGVLPAQGCRGIDTVRIWTNTAGRTIATGQAYAEGLAPRCDLTIGHRPTSETDPLFEPLNANPKGFEAARAVDSINLYLGSATAQVARHRAALTLLKRVLACPDGPCSPERPAFVQVSRDGRGIDVSGPIRDASGTAQVLMLQYLEGMPMAQVGWGRAGPATLVRLGAVHAALFDIYSRPPYMAAFQTAPTVDRILSDFTAPSAPALDVLVGHDTNVAALAAVLGVKVQAPGFAAGDPSPGGGLALALVRQPGGGEAVRLWYRSQSAAGIRTGNGAAIWTPLAIPGCSEGPMRLCPLPRFIARLESATAPARQPG